MCKYHVYNKKLNIKENKILNIVEWADISFDLPPQLPSLPQEVGSYGFPTLRGQLFQKVPLSKTYTCAILSYLRFAFDLSSGLYIIHVTYVSYLL